MFCCLQAAALDTTEFKPQLLQTIADWVLRAHPQHSRLEMVSTRAWFDPSVVSVDSSVVGVDPSVVGVDSSVRVMHLWFMG